MEPSTMTMTTTPCPTCEGRGFITIAVNQEKSFRTKRLRCEYCLETGKIIAADTVMTYTIKGYGGSVYYWGNQWALVNPHGDVEGSHECNVVSMFHRAISHGLG